MGGKARSLPSKTKVSLLEDGVKHSKQQAQMYNERAKFFAGVAAYISMDKGQEKSDLRRELIVQAQELQNMLVMLKAVNPVMNAKAHGVAKNYTSNLIARWASKFLLVGNDRH